MHCPPPCTSPPYGDEGGMSLFLLPQGESLDCIIRAMESLESSFCGPLEERITNLVLGILRTMSASDLPTVCLLERCNREYT